MKTIAIEELVPFLDERPLTEASLLELGFEKVETGGSSPYYFQLELHELNLCLLSQEIKSEDSLQTYYVVLFERPDSIRWTTVGGLATLLIALQGEQDYE